MSEADGYCKEQREIAPEALPMRDAESMLVAIRQRLATVAGELRSAAQAAGPSGEALLALADRFEQHAQAGDAP